jgi:hypothetical protein
MRDRHHPSVQLGDEPTLFVVESLGVAAGCESGMIGVWAAPTLEAVFARR